MYKSLIVMLLFAITVSCHHDHLSSRFHGKSIILYIGDGMGAEQRKAAQWYAYGLDSQLAMDQLPYRGMAITQSASNLITDSAAAATAISTGIKTNNGFIAMDPFLNVVTTILEIARSKGMSTGLITNTQLTHATPAAFSTHVNNRNLMNEIALQMINADINVLLGGGEGEFLPTGSAGHYPEDGKRNDGRNLIAEAMIRGYHYIYDEQGLSAIDVNSITKLLGLFSDEDMMRPNNPSLAAMTSKAIDILKKNTNGFFLMVEGGQIDWAGHTNDAINNMMDVLEFDDAVSFGMRYLNENSNTLLVVAADHETGGMEVTTMSSGSVDEDGPYHMPDGTQFYIKWMGTSHTGINVPVTAGGYSSVAFSGVFDNTYIFEIMNSHIQ